MSAALVTGGAGDDVVFVIPGTRSGSGTGFIDQESRDLRPAAPEGCVLDPEASSG